jgi:hypothetical protein
LLIGVLRDNEADAWFRRYKKTRRMLFPPDNLDERSDMPMVKVAVIDTGIDESHPFIKKWWIRPEPGNHDQDLKNIRYFDFLGGADTEGAAKDNVGHGTHVSGIILQLAPFVELYIAKVFDGPSFDFRAASRVSKASKQTLLSYPTNTI